MRPVGIVAAVVLGVVAAALVQVIISYVPLVRKARANAPVPALATPGAGGAIGGVKKKLWSLGFTYLKLLKGSADCHAVILRRRLHLRGIALPRREIREGID